jgi:hypothetical protein
MVLLISTFIGAFRNTESPFFNGYLGMMKPKLLMHLVELGLRTRLRLIARFSAGSLDSRYSSTALTASRTGAKQLNRRLATAFLKSRRRARQIGLNFGRRLPFRAVDGNEDLTPSAPSRWRRLTRCPVSRAPELAQIARLIHDKT